MKTTTIIIIQNLKKLVVCVKIKKHHLIDKVQLYSCYSSSDFRNETSQFCGFAYTETIVDSKRPISDKRSKDAGELHGVRV